MSTLPGNASKGEKGKQRYRSLDINSLYQVSRPEQHQQKNSLPRRNVGMQSLGKIPPTRRVPANLPSLKSEHSGNDLAVSLVPSGSTGWGSKPGETGPQPPPQPPQSTTATTPTTQSSTPVATVTAPQQQQQQQPSVTSTASAPTTVVTSIATTSAPTIPTQSSHGDKSWSAITSSGGESVPSYFAHQSPFFHQEFPSLSGSDAGTTPCPPMTTKPDTQYATGPSLRPQTEGSWMQGGSRPQGQMGVGAGNPQGTAPVQGPLPLPHLPPGIDVGGGRNNLGQSGVGVAQGGPVPPQGHHMPPPHFKGVLPPFMYRPNFTGGFPPSFTNPMHGQLRTRSVLSYPNENRPAPAADPEDLVPRPIIKEEDLNRMDDIARDAGWAGQDDIDYNQELTFSDDEGCQEKETNKNKISRTPTQTREQEKHSEKDSESVDREDRSSRENGREKTSSQPPENRTAPPEPSRGWQQPRSPAEYRPSPPNVVNFPPQPLRAHPHHMTDGGRLLDEDELWQEKLRVQNMQVAIATEKARQRKNEEEKRYEESRQAIERAKQRKEEEEKRYEESRQAATKKLQKLEEKMGVSSSSGSAAEDKERVESSTPPASTVVTPQTVNIALPDWEKDKDKDRSRTSSEGKEDRSTKESVDNFRQMTQSEGRSNFIREREKERDRDMRGERDPSNQHQVSGQPAFSRQFQSNLPPRFQRQQAERPQQAYFRQQSGGSPQPPSAPSMCEPRWNNSNHFAGSGGSLKSRRNRTDSDVSDRDREDDRSGKDSMRDRRDRNTPDNNYDRDRYRHDRGRDNRAGSNTYDNKWKSSAGYYEGPDYSSSYRDYDRSHDYDRHREREQEVDDRRDRDVWDREKDNRYYDEHSSIEKKSADNYKPHASVPMDPFEDRDLHQMARHESERIERDRDSDRGSVSERRSDYEKEAILSEQPQRSEPHQHSDSRDRQERPQRPDSRDSRTSRESRNSRDSMREDTKSIQECVNDREFSWADSHFEPEPKEERPKRKEYREETRRDMYPSYPQRHIPGPITKERLEAAERGNEPAKRNMLPLVRSDKKTDLKRAENQKEKQEQKSEDVHDAWHSVQPSVSEPSPPSQPVSKSWAETTEEPVSPLPVPEKTVSNEQDSVPETIQSEGVDESQQQQQQQKSETVDNNTVVKSERDEQELNHRIESHREKGGRGGRGARHDSRGAPRQSWGSSMYRNAWRGDGRGRRGGSRGQPRSQTNQDWGHSESEVSADEVSASTESGKEERERRQERGHKNAPRSPKQLSRKADKENRSRESRRNDSDKSSYNDTRHYEKRGSYESQRTVGCGREGGFAPRGEPSRRGRGAAFRARGNTPNVGQRVNSYGPPTSSKSPFTSQSSGTNEDKKVDELDKNVEVTVDRKNDDQQDHCASSMDLSIEDKTKKNQQLLSAGIKGSGPRQNTKPSRYKSENDRRERSVKSKEDSRRNQRGSLKGNGTGGSGSGGDQGDEAWETTSETSDQDDKDREVHETQRRNYSSGRHVSRGSGRRNSHSARSGGDKRGHDRSREVSRSTGSSNVGNSQVSMNGRGPTASSKMSSNSVPSPNAPKDQIPIYRTDDIKYSDSVFQSDTKKQQRTDKEKNSINRVPEMSNFLSMVVVDGRTEEEHSVFAADSGGFQEVRSKKNFKEANRQQKEDVPQKGPRGGSTGSKDRGKSGNKPPSAQSPSPVCGLPSIGPPASQNNPPQASNKTFERKLSNKLPPRLMKQKQQQLRQQQQQQQQQEEVAEMNKLNQGVPLFPIKDLTSPAPPPTVNAWDKPITALRTATSPPTSANMQLALSTQDNCLFISSGIDIGEHPPSGASSQRSSPSGEKALNKMTREAVEKTVLDGTSPPVQTIIFENTSLKEKISAPGDLSMKSKYNHHLKNQRMDKIRDRKLEDESGHVGLGGFKSASADMKTQDSKNDPIQMPVSFNKNEDSADMKLDFAFDSELSQLTDDKSSKGMGLQHSMQMVQSSTAADSKLLNFKIASVKKVWENSIPPVIEHHSEDGTVSTSSSFTQGFGNSVEDPTSYVKSGVGVMDSSGVQVDDNSSLNSGEVYSTGQQIQSSSNSYSTGSVVSVPNVIKNDPNSSSSNVCKVKPQPQAVMSSGGLGGHPHPGPLSPPPGPFNSSSAQPSGHINFQPAAQYSGVGVSAIPSPPAMLYGSQQIPAQELYHQTFQIGNTPVIGGQARSQYSQLPPYGLSQGLGQTSAFNQQSVYLQTPPSGAPPPDIYQSQFRIQPHSYGSSQTMNSSHNAVLISSSTNSLMSASVKPSSQPIGAIGSKGGFQPSTPSTAMFIQYDPNSVMNQNYSHIVQQRPGNNMVSAMQPSSSFYSASAGGGATGFYQPTNSTLQAPQTAQTIQTQFGVQGYSTHTQSPATAQVGPVGMPTYTSQFLSNTLQMAQQYRTSAPSYLKSSGAVTLVSDPSKSPSTNQQDVLNSVFSSAGVQIASPKSRGSGNGGGSGKPGSSSSGGPSQQQSSPTQGHHKIAPYHSVSQVIQQQQQQAGGRGAMSVRGGNIQAQVPRYPSPIQRPVAFQQPIPGVPSANMIPGRHRVTSRAPPHLVNKIPSAAASAQYYNSHNNGVKLETSGLENKSEVNVSTNECNKLSDNGSSVAANKQTVVSDTPAEDSKPKAD